MQRSAIHTLCYLIITCGILAGLPSLVSAQVGIRGLIQDANGNAIPGARVTAESTQTSATRNAISDSSGSYALVGLEIGQWHLIIDADGFRQAQGYAGVTGFRESTTVDVTLELNILDPPPPTVGILAGVRSSDLLSTLNDADQMVARGDYNGALEQYRSILDQTPNLTSIYLHIGYAFLAKQEPDNAIAAYQKALEADPTNPEILAAISTVRGRPSLPLRGLPNP